MRRLLSLTIAAITVVGAALAWSPRFSSLDRSAFAYNKCPSGMICDSTSLPAGGNRPSLEVPSEDAVYCNSTEYPQNPEFHQIFLSDFVTADDRTVSTPDSGLPSDVGGGAPIVVPKIAVAQRVRQFCKSIGPAEDAIVNQHDFWVPLATPDSVALTAGLLAKVQGRLTMPPVTWLDIDKDHGWLWVNIEHHVGITPPLPVNESASDGNPVTGFATAWVKPTPVSFTIDLPSKTGVERRQLAKCDLLTATSNEGCKIRFTHSSSISNDGWFSGRATITWAVSSNSGKYNGVGPFTTSSEVRIQVAEMMAVSRSGG